MSELEITINRDGSQVIIEAHNFSGEGCVEATKNIIGSLGNVIQDEKKPEYYEQVRNSIDQRA